MPFGFAGVATGAATVFFAFIGFDAVSTAAEEVRNPQRDMPIGIMGSLAVATVLYVAVAAIMTGVVPYRELNVADPVALVLNTLDKKMADTSGVNMDEEMAHLLALQNAYSANARVMSTVNEMYKTMLQAF